MAPPAPKDLVIFDLGGVLVRIRHGLVACAEAIGVSLDEKSMMAADTEEVAGVMDSYQAGKMNLADFSRTLSRALDGVCSPEQVEAMHHEVLLGPYAGAEELVAELQRGGTATAILSNTCAVHWQVLQHYRAIAAISPKSWYLSFELGYAKPTPMIYEQVEHLSGRRPEEIVFVDDNPSNVKAAADRGWRAKEIPAERDGMGEVLTALRSLGIAGV